jgi:hypothetical protein
MAARNKAQSPYQGIAEPTLTVSDGSGKSGPLFDENFPLAGRTLV